MEHEAGSDRGAGVIVSEVTDSALPKKIQAGMLLEVLFLGTSANRVGEKVLTGLSHIEVTDTIEIHNPKIPDLTLIGGNRHDQGVTKTIDPPISEHGRARNTTDISPTLLTGR